METNNDKIIAFKYEYRNYQKRALKEIDKYVDDNKIHIVAAPGAGKTILALKLVFDFNVNTLILVPTIAIREQWVERMLNDFTNIDKKQISTSLKELKKFNIISYQALYEYDKEEIKKIIKKNNIHTIVLDEAHHLRNAWWKLLSQVFEELKNIKIISLTATPPYDDEKNFEKYIGLCGEIDAQINIPELVGEKNLCPHQDFIYLNVPTKEQEKQINEYRVNSIKIIKWLNNNQSIIKAIATHKFIIDYKNNIDDIITNYNIFIIMLKFLNDRNIFVNQYIKDVNISYSPMKICDYENLFKYLLYTNDKEFEIIESTLKELKSMLLQVGAIDNGNINLLYNKKIEKELSQNIGKLNSINTIIEHEYNNLKEKLKLVVVTDFIKDDYSDFDDSEINQLGVMPIFRNITQNLKSLKICVLTGSTIIIPTDTVQIFMDICKNNNIKDENIVVNEIGNDFKYSRIQLRNNSLIVKIITELFKKSDISVLIGTVALIGEGWDAPFVNTLIMASSISSYVTSNQIRGRAIRIDKNNISKEANIWHLVCLEKCGNRYVKGKDYEKIEKRFNAIEGLALTENKLVSNINRFDYFDRSLVYEDISRINNIMLEESSKRELISKRWFIALKKYIPNNKLLIKKENILKNKKLIYKKNVNHLLAIGAIDILALGLLQTPFWIALLSTLNAGAIVKIITNTKYNKRALRSISKAICFALKQKNILDKDSYVDIKLVNGKYEITLINADIRCQNLFMKCLNEAISKKCNSRYILIANEKVFNIPSLFDKNKEGAEFFRKAYNKTNYTLKSQILYSKNGKGKLERLKLLLNQEDIFKSDEQEIFDSNVDIKWLSAALGIDNDLEIKL